MMLLWSTIDELLLASNRAFQNHKTPTYMPMEQIAHLTLNNANRAYIYIYTEMCPKGFRHEHTLQCNSFIHETLGLLPLMSGFHVSIIIIFLSTVPL